MKPTPSDRHRKAINAGFVLAILSLAWVGWYAHRHNSGALGSARWVDHTHRVLQGLQSLLSSMQDAETGQRGYIISGKDRYLEPYTRAITRVGGQLGYLRGLTSDNPEQQQRLNSLVGITERRLRALNEGIALRRDRGIQAAVEHVLEGYGLVLMDSARAAIGEMTAIESGLLQARLTRSEVLAKESKRAILLATVLGLLLLATSALLANREIRARLKAEALIRSSNEDLEGRVAERTEELECLNEELRVENEERATVETELRSQKDFLRKVVDTNPQLVFIKDWDGRFVLANRAVAELYGTSVQDLEGKSDSDFNPNPAEVEGFLRVDRDVMQSGRVVVLPEEAVTDSTGAVRWFQTIKVALTTPEAPGKYVLGVSSDITARRVAEEQLRRTADELEALVQAAPVAIVGIDMDGQVVSWYGGAQSMFGWSSADVIGKPLANVPFEKQEEFVALRHRVMQGHSIMGLESQRIRKDGSRIDVSISYAPLHDHAGSTVGAIIVYQDITERRLVAEQRQARQAADAANRAKSNFLANMSHELRTPLNAIIGFSELLEDQTFGDLNDRQKRYVTNVASSGRHLLQLVNDILDLAKIESGRVLVEVEPIDLTALLHDMHRGMEPLAAAKRQRFVIDLPDDLPCLTADRAKVKQVLYNLLSNAIKFTREGGQVRLHATPVRSEDGAEQLQVAVSDTGIGIAPEDLHRIFLEFEQVDSSYVRQQEGTGLGLALTRRLVEAHGGRIWVDSIQDQGSTFTFVLPTTPAVTSLEPWRPTAAHSAGDGSDGPLVLIVEDDVTARELLSHYLLEHGYRVAYAGNSAEAIERARRLQPAAISLDIFLPDEHGLQVLSKLRADPSTKDIPVVIVSITDDRELGLSAGAAAWLVKPVQRQQFIEALDRLVPVAGNGRRLALVVDDDHEAVELASDVLRSRGFEVLQAFGGTQGLALAIRHAPAVIILDLNMPRVSGFTVAQQLRAHPRTRQTPILVSTALDLTERQRAELMRDVQTIVPKGGAQGILEALDRLGLTPGRPRSWAGPPPGVTPA